MLIWILLIFAPLVHEKQTLKKVQGVTVIGITTILVGIGLIIGVGLSEGWASFLPATLGQ